VASGKRDGGRPPTLKELWDSRQDAARDDVGAFAKFNAPTTANGKVYVPTFSSYLAIYGLLPR
jgi:hypothetical protein